MIIQLSSGQGPIECELAVRMLYESLIKDYKNIKGINKHPSRQEGCYTSILFETDADLSDLEGSIQWICQSPFRPNHKRKNWFVDISIIPKQEANWPHPDLRFERFHCGGKGGDAVTRKATCTKIDAN